MLFPADHRLRDPPRNKNTSSSCHSAEGLETEAQALLPMAQAVCPGGVQMAYFCFSFQGRKLNSGPCARQYHLLSSAAEHYSSQWNWEAALYRSPCHSTKASVSCAQSNMRLGTNIKQEWVSKQGADPQREKNHRFYVKGKD